ncbi:MULTISPECIES: DUF1310 family protein [Gemella]|uniref:DUF1310 family protein n=1 Tax=Gemella TaxID=1378 RepID=UPI0007681CD2|nr:MULTISPECIES: DUF1310 family protein [Gemella]AME08766.1 hypothetical protein AXE85_00435 [Gemella sp. oral taxon 928]AXI26340.1 DUF1310 domain-containing protein [Gemella sp. ND 6198]
MKKRIVGTFAFIVAIGGVIYMKNNPRYKEIIKTVKTADTKGLYKKIILEKDKQAFTTKSKIKNYAIDYESIRGVGEKIFTRLIINDNSRFNINTLIIPRENTYNIEKIEYSKELEKLLKSDNNNSMMT